MKLFILVSVAAVLLALNVEQSNAQVPSTISCTSPRPNVQACRCCRIQNTNDAFCNCNQDADSDCKEDKNDAIDDCDDDDNGNNSGYTLLDEGYCVFACVATPDYGRTGRSPGVFGNNCPATTG